MIKSITISGIPLVPPPPYLSAPDLDRTKSWVIVLYYFYNRIVITLDSFIYFPTRWSNHWLKCLAPRSTCFLSSFEAVYSCESLFFCARLRRAILNSTWYSPPQAGKPPLRVQYVIDNSSQCKDSAPCSWEALCCQSECAPKARPKILVGRGVLWCARAQTHWFPPYLRSGKGEEGGQKPMEFHW